MGDKDLEKCSDGEKKYILTLRKIKHNYGWYLSIGFCFGNAAFPRQ